MKYKYLILILLLGLSFISNAQMVDGKEIPEFGETFSVDVGKTTFEVEALLFESPIPGNILWPNEQPVFTIQLINHTNRQVNIDGKLEVISYGTKGQPGDIWVPEMFKIANEGSHPIKASIQPNGFANLEIKVSVPGGFGAYGLVADLQQFERQFITSCIRTFSAETKSLQYPSFCLDDLSNKVLSRLGVQAIRYGVDYLPSTDAEFEKWFDDHRKRLKAYQDANIAVLIKFGVGPQFHPYEVNGTPRPWLDKNGVMQNTKCDMAWMPQYDEDFKKVVEMFAAEFGWPKGPVNAVALWNEPWEGISISGWGADMLRYREIFTKMCEGVEAARKVANVQVLTGGGSSTSNSLDKLFGDGSDEFLNRFDFFSIHYQGMDSYATIKKFVNRQSERGRTKVWDTESWVANTDDRVAAVVSTNKAAGYDRAMGIYAGNICHVRHNNVFNASGKREHKEVIHAWSVAASIGASQHFLGERKFKEILFKKGLPWVYLFEGQDDNNEDGTIVVVGDIGEEFGANNVLFRTARGLHEVAYKEEVIKQLVNLNPEKDKEKIAKLKEELEKPMVLQNGNMIIDNPQNQFSLFDFYGNPVPSEENKIVVPLDHRGFYLRANGSEGSFQKLLQAVNKSYIEGLEPLETIVHDLQKTIQSNPELHITLTNILNRPVKGSLIVNAGGLNLKEPVRQLSFAPFETKELHLKIDKSKPSPDNTYLLDLVFDAGKDGKAVHQEEFHVNVIAKKEITVDGDLADWAGILPQTILPQDNNTPSLTEFAWQPFKQFDKNAQSGLANGYLAYDDQYFYFAAKVADDTPDEGMIRVETRDDNQFFYPEKYYIPANAFSFGGAMKHQQLDFSIKWSGKIKPKHSGEYTLTVKNDDDVKVWINDQLLLDKSGHEVREASAKYTFKGKQLYDIRIDYSHTEWENPEGVLQLYWQSEKQPKELIPSSAFFQHDGKIPGLTAQYFAGPEYNKLIEEKVDSQINFTWNKKEAPTEGFKGNIEYTWPTGIRRFSYRMDPEVPSGNFPNHDNVQIAFNVLSEDEKDMFPFPPGTMKGFTGYICTDYEFALNPIAERFGGGTEIYRLRVPGMPHKHHYPRQGKSPFDGPVKNGKIVSKHECTTRIVEAAIPWSEIPHVKQKLDAGQPIKFSFRVNDNGSDGCRELARGRSVSKINNSFRVDWKEHWANEVEFSFEK